MQNFKLITLSGILLAGSAVAQTEGATKPARDAAVQERAKTADVDAEVDRAIGALERKALAKTATKADFQAVSERLAAQAKVDGVPDAEKMRQRLQLVVNDLEARSKNAALDKHDFAQLRGQVIDSRMDRAMILLEKKAAQRGATAQDVAKLKRLVQARAEAAKSVAADNSKMREQFGTVLANLENRAKNAGITIQDVQAARATVVETRLDAALGDLENQALAKKANRSDFQRVQNQIEDRAKLMQTANAANPAAKDLATKYTEALRSLQDRAMKGEVTREDFQTLRTQLGQRARNAEKGAQQKAGGAAREQRKREGAKGSDTKRDADDARDAEGAGQDIDARREDALKNAREQKSKEARERAEKATGKGAEKRQEGRERAEQARGKGAEKRQEGRERAEQAKGKGTEKRQEGRERAEQAKGKGTEKSKDGRERAAKGAKRGDDDPAAARGKKDD